MYSILDVKNYDLCEKYFWFTKNKDEPSSSMIHYHEDFMSLCKELLMISHAYDARESSILDIKQVLESETAVVHASFTYYHLQITIPIMIKGESGWNIYFPYEVCYLQEEEIQYIADHVHVLASFAIPIEGIYIIYLQANYERDDSLELSQLFKISEYIHSSNGGSKKKIKDLVSSLDRDLFSYQQRMDTCMKNKVMKNKHMNQCRKGMKCPYYRTCLSSIEKDTSILLLNSCTHRLEMYEEGILDMKDTDINRIEGTKLQYAQIMAARLNGIYCDTYAIKTWIDECIQYPISYLGFTGDTFTIPPYPRMKPYDTLCFQYSLHIEDAQGTQLQHRQFLGTGDCRIAFIEQLLHDIPTEGSIMVFHMEGAEKLHLKKLAIQFPQYRDALYGLCDRIVDLSLPFFSGSLYDNRMRGQYSLKVLRSLYSNEDYSHLPISNAFEAVKKWRRLEALNGIEKEQMKKELYAYGKMDTYTKYNLFHAIKDIVKEKEKYHYTYIV